LKELRCQYDSLCENARQGFEDVVLTSEQVNSCHCLLNGQKSILDRIENCVLEIEKKKQK